MKYLVSILLLISAFITNAQTNPATIYSNLKNGAILVRLKTNSNTIKALKGNNDELMERVIAKRDKQNREIIDAFDKVFTLCPVYYFYSDDSKSIAEQKFEGVLLNNKLNKVKNIPHLKNNYLIMEFSYLMQNTDSTWSYSEWGVKDGKSQMVDYYAGGSEKGPDALIVLMPDFRLVPTEYPYYARTFKGLPIIERSKEETIKRIVEKFEYFYTYK